MTEPIPVLSLDYAPPAELPRRGWRKGVRWMLPLMWLVCIIALICIPLITVESVLFSGPIILAGGLFLMTGAVLIRESLCIIIAAAHCAICLLFFGLVNLLGWSPDDARIPFIVMGAIYVVLSFILSFKAWQRLRSQIRSSA